MRLATMLGREPMLLVTCGYLFVSIVGIWDSYWFYRRFDVPILEYMQSSDYFVAGLRRPAFAMALAGVLLMAAVALWPDRWSARNPERAEHLRQTTWWGKLLLVKRYDKFGYGGMHPETATTLVSVASIIILLFMATSMRANRIKQGGGHSVRVTLVDASSPIPGRLRLLGTSSAFVFLWRPDENRTQVVPIQGIGHIETIKRSAAKPAGSDAPTRPAKPAAQAGPPPSHPPQPE